MTSLRHDRDGLSRAHSVSLQVPSEQEYLRNGRPRRNVSLMRKYEAAALLPDLTISFTSHVAPASPLFEEAATGFARGTPIQTVRGPVAIEDLLPGDYIETSNGTEPVLWIGSTSYIPGRDDDGTTLTHLTRITSHAFGVGQPQFDILVGPAARMTVRHAKLKTLLGQETVLAPVADYVDGDRFIEITPAGLVQLYHLMVKRHGTIRIGGLEMETYHPGNSAGSAMGENQRALFLSMFPNIEALEDFGEVTLTRTTREVVESLINT